MIKTYQGGCHCKKVRYEAELDLTQPAIECNCSHCAVKGLLLEFVPAEKVNVLEGEDELTEYRFNKEKIAHLFCKKCGVQPFGRGQNSEGASFVGINSRTIDEINLEALPRKKVDGKSY